MQAMKLFKYRNSLGLPSYRKYREVQIEANKRKIDKQWIDESSIQWISQRVLEIVPSPRFGLCHGTRRGLEQTCFRKYLECEVRYSQGLSVHDRMGFSRCETGMAGGLRLHL